MKKNPNEQKERKQDEKLTPIQYKIGSALTNQKVHYFQDLIKKADKEHPDDLEKRIEFIYFYSNKALGKQIQIFVYKEKTINVKQFLEISYNESVYVIWRCELMTDD